VTDSERVMGSIADRLAIQDQPAPKEAIGDNVNHPRHYQGHNGVECIDAIEAALSREEFIGFLRGQILKYTWRRPHKGSHAEDCKKCRWYQDRLIKTLEKPNG